MLIKLEGKAYIPFSLRDPTSGEAIAGTINGVTVYSQDSLTPLTTDASHETLTATGQYVAKVSCTAVSGFVVGTQYSIRVNATVDTVTDETQVGTFQISAATHGSVIGNSIPEINAGAAGGLLIAGTNAPVTIEAVSDGSALTLIGNDTGHGLHVQSGDNQTVGADAIKAEAMGITGNGIVASGTGSGNGLYCFSAGAGAGLAAASNSTGPAVNMLSVGGVGMKVQSFASHGIEVTAGGAAGDGITVSGAGTGVGAVGLFEQVFYGQPASELISFAAAGAGVGKVSSSAGLGSDSRTETFRYPDDSGDAFVVVADELGNRTNITF